MTHTQQGMQRYLTTSQKDRYLPFIIQRDGTNCFYCGMAFSINDKALRRTYDHLNNDPRYNDPQNLVLCHWKCNQTKKYNQEFIIKATTKLRENKLLVDSLSVSVSSTPQQKETNKEMDVNVATNKMTKQYLHERLMRQGLPALNFNDTANSIGLLMFESTGHGSSETAKRSIRLFCSSCGPYDEVDENGTSVIRKKQSINQELNQ